MTLTDDFDSPAVPAGWNETCDSAEDGHGTDHGSLEAARLCAWRSSWERAHKQHLDGPMGAVRFCPLCAEAEAK